MEQESTSETLVGNEYDIDVVMWRLSASKRRTIKK
jgi:hypothetical protein